MKSNTIILICFLFLAGIFLSVPVTTPAASLSLAIPGGKPGTSVKGSFGFEDAEGVASFSLRLSFASDNILSTNPSKFTRNSDFFPGLSIGGQEANFTEEVRPGKIYFVGLLPGSSAGSADIGDIIFDIAGSAVPGEDQQVVTLSGKAYTNAGIVADLAPVSATVKVMQDVDKDGMDDNWEQQIIDANPNDSIRTLPDVRPNDDFDSDGYTNIEEHEGGSDPVNPYDPACMKGDVGKDGEITPQDAVDAFNLSLEISWTPEELCAADYDGDGEVTPEDAVSIFMESF